MASLVSIAPAIAAAGLTSPKPAVLPRPAAPGYPRRPKWSLLFAIAWSAAAYPAAAVTGDFRMPVTVFNLKGNSDEDEE